MKKICASIVILSLSLFVLLSTSTAQTIWYVSTTGSDSNGDGSIENPFQTIQRGIDAANNDDITVVMEGKYTGPGNRNLNFSGKAITLRSLNPKDNECMRRTIIDAEGQGVIVRFVSDEGPECVFEGFTLIAGDTSKPVRGLPGFFEFSLKARPTTRRLRIERSHIIQTQSQSPTEAAEPPYGGRVWDGNNPFHQPAATTDYYGSGDVDADGSLTEADASLAQEMAKGFKEPSPRADADGNGVVNASDVDLINSALAGGTLSGWWNSLSDQAARKSWVRKFTAIDRTEVHTPYDEWWVCGQFADQTFIHGAYYRGDLNYTEFNGGQTLFNLPIYTVFTATANTGHLINAVLLGDDPLNFDQWFFFEPQTDDEVHPGMWSMAYNSPVSIEPPNMLRLGSSGGPFKVRFFVDEDGWTLEEYSQDLIVIRSPPSPGDPDNRPDLWNPRFLPSTNMIVYERIRDDMSGKTDIHLAELPFVEPPNDDAPLILSSQYSRLLDITKASDGTVHLLWKGKPDYDPGIFHGRLDPEMALVTDVTRVCSETPFVYTGRIIVTPVGDVHVFWYEYGYKRAPGIYWSRWTGSAWQGKQKLVDSALTSYSNPYDWGKRELVRYIFDVSVIGQSNLILVLIDSGEWSGVTTIYQLLYDGQWRDKNPIEVIDNVYRGGVDLATDFTGNLHLAYWLDPDEVYESCRGNMFHRTYDGDSWSIPYLIDEGGEACCPDIAIGNDGSIGIVWERDTGKQVVPMFTKHSGGSWGIHNEFNIRPGEDAWYPTIEIDKNGAFIFAWSARSNDHVTISVLGNSDFILTANQQHTIDVRLSQGNGSFDPPFTVGEDLGVDYGESAIADFTGDGRFDFIAATNENPSRLYMFIGTLSNTFNQTFLFDLEADSKAAYYLDPSGGNNPLIAPDYGLGLIASDLDNDGDIDFLENINHDFGSHKYWIAKGNAYLNDGKGNFTKVSNAFDFTSIFTGWTLGMSNTLLDIDGDGYPDMLASEQKSGGSVSSKVYLLKGKGDGTFLTPVKVFTTLNRPATFMTLGDFNNDGKVDAIVGQDDDGDPGAAFLFLGNGNGTFQWFGREAFDVWPIESGNDQPGSGCFQAYDADHDGFLDIVSAAKVFGPNPSDPQDAVLFFFRSLGDGYFDDPQVIEVDLLTNTAFAVPLTAPGELKTKVNEKFPPLGPEDVYAWHESTPCAAGYPAGTLYIVAYFKNISSDTLHNLFFKVHTLTEGNVLCNADGGPGGVGSTLTESPKDGLAPGEEFSVFFDIGLADMKPFEFYVDLYGDVK